MDISPQQAKCERQERWRRHTGLVVTWLSTGFAYTQALTMVHMHAPTPQSAHTPLTDRRSTSGNTFLFRIHFHFSKARHLRYYCVFQPYFVLNVVHIVIYTYLSYCVFAVGMMLFRNEQNTTIYILSDVCGSCYCHR